MPKCCSYCESEHHNISVCPVDNDLDKLLDSIIEPNFNNLSIKVLKKLAALTGLKTSLPKIQLAITFKRTWMMRGRRRTEELETQHQKVLLVNKEKQQKQHQVEEECPVCMDVLGQVNRCITKCGHMFCSTCFIKTAMRKNSCPMCRSELIESSDYGWPNEEPSLIENMTRNVTMRRPINRSITRNNALEMIDFPHTIINGESDILMSSILDNIDNIFDDDDTMAVDNSEQQINDMYYEDDMLTPLEPLALPLPSDDYEQTQSTVHNHRPVTPDSSPPLSPIISTISSIQRSDSDNMMVISQNDTDEMDNTIREIILNMEYNNNPDDTTATTANPMPNFITIRRPTNSLEHMNSVISYTNSAAQMYYQP